MADDLHPTFQQALKKKASPGISNENLKEVLAYDVQYIQQEIDGIEKTVKRLVNHLEFLKWYQERLINDIGITRDRL